MKANPDDNTLKANADDNTLKANPDDNTLKANPALCKQTTIRTTAQIMHKSDNKDNNNKDTSKMQYFTAMHMLVFPYT